MVDTKKSTRYELDSVSPFANTRLPPATAPSNEDPPKSVIDADNDGTDPETNSHGQKIRSGFCITMIIIALFLSLFLAALNATIVATATITSDLNSPSGYAWIGGAYLIANAAGATIWAKLSDIWGYKPILLGAVALFIVSSIMCTLAEDMKMVIAGRVVQVTAGGGLITMVNIIISNIFSMRRRSLFLGLCEAIWAIAGAIGPLLGGVLTDLASWRWCWWINLPSCGIAFFIIVFFLDVHNPRTPLVAGVKAIDWAGSYLSSHSPFYSLNAFLARQSTRSLQRGVG